MIKYFFMKFKNVFKSPNKLNFDTFLSLYKEIISIFNYYLNQSNDYL